MTPPGGGGTGVKAAALEALGVTIGRGRAIASGESYVRAAAAAEAAAVPDIQTAAVAASVSRGAEADAGGLEVIVTRGMQAAATHNLALIPDTVDAGSPATAAATAAGATTAAVTARQRPGHEQAPAPAGWSFAGLAGRFVELSAGWNSAALTLATSLVWQAQRAGEPTAWIMGEGGGFFPPDAAANGVDLAALAVIRVPYNPARIPENDAARAPDMWEYSNNAAKAAGRLARSGAFGLIVLDLGARACIAPALQGSLVQQAQRHGTAIVCLTEKPPRSDSLGALVALRGQARRQRRGEHSFACVLEAVKDKRRGPGWMHEEEAHGPPGLR